MQPKFMAVMGPSGVGKSTVMRKLESIDGRFILIKTHVTRLLRTGETDRVSLPLEELMAMRRKGEALQVNHIYGSYYAALPKMPIQEALSKSRFPMCDYKIPAAADLRRELSGAVFGVYLIPPSIDMIRARLERAGRVADPIRLDEDSREVLMLDTAYRNQVDLKIVAEEGAVDKIAEKIRDAYLDSIKAR
jgi:guanylate kinase